MSRHIPCAPVEKVGRDTGGGGCSKKRELAHLCACNSGRVVDELTAFFASGNSAYALEFPGAKAPSGFRLASQMPMFGIERYFRIQSSSFSSSRREQVCLCWWVVTGFEQPRQPCRVEDRSRLRVIRQSCPSPHRARPPCPRCSRLAR